MDKEKLIQKTREKFNASYLYQTRENAVKFQSWEGPPALLTLTEHLIGLRDEILEFIEQCE